MDCIIELVGTCRSLHCSENFIWYFSQLSEGEPLHILQRYVHYSNIVWDLLANLTADADPFYPRLPYDSTLIQIFVYFIIGIFKSSLVFKNENEFAFKPCVNFVSVSTKALGMFLRVAILEHNFQMSCFRWIVITLDFNAWRAILIYHFLIVKAPLLFLVKFQVPYWILMCWIKLGACSSLIKA